MTYTRELPPTACAAQTTVRIALLGPPLLRLGNQPFALVRRQARALLYRIAAASHPVPRGHLAFLLWPDSPEAAARRKLTVLLNLIRRALPRPDLLVTLDDALGLDPTAAQTDTAALATLIPQAISTGQLDLLAAALRGYRGPFLDGFVLPNAAEFDAWASQERWVWERRYLDALTVLADGYTTAGMYHAAIDAAQRALATDELAEHMHRRLIALYAAAGDRAAALRQYEQCVVVLARELGAAPLPTTRAAFEAVRNGHSPLDDRPIGEHNAARDSLAWPAPLAAQLVGTAPHPTMSAPTNPLLERAAIAAARLPIILLTANADEVRQRLPNDAALGAHLVAKPFALDGLLGLVHQALGARARGGHG